MENSKLGVFWNIRFKRTLRSPREDSSSFSFFAGMSVVNERLTFTTISTVQLSADF